MKNVCSSYEIFQFLPICFPARASPTLGLVISKMNGVVSRIPSMYGSLRRQWKEEASGHGPLGMGPSGRLKGGERFKGITGGEFSFDKQGGSVGTLG